MGLDMTLEPDHCVFDRSKSSYIHREKTNPLHHFARPNDFGVGGGGALRVLYIIPEVPNFNDDPPLKTGTCPPQDIGASLLYVEVSPPNVYSYGVLSAAVGVECRVLRVYTGADKAKHTDLHAHHDVFYLVRPDGCVFVQFFHGPDRTWKKYPPRDYLGHVIGG